MTKDATIEEIDIIMQEAWSAFHIYRKMPLQTRAKFMRAIATQLEESSDELIQTVMEETHLPEPRLRSERARTIFQLTSYAAACENGGWMDIRIDTAVADRNPPKPDLRKMLVPLGPVVVFGASNFPFAYSTGGGDTACAFAAGCPVIVKAHPAHTKTSELVAEIILHAASLCDMPKGIFAHVKGVSTETGKALVMHPYTKAVGFTGSLIGGKQLFDWGNQRKEPIPVFAEMGSVNPIFLFPEKLENNPQELAQQIISSVTLGVGQFCTNPGLIIGIESPALHSFVESLKSGFAESRPGVMLHTGIYKSYVENRANALSQEGVELLAIADETAQLNEGIPTVASVAARKFLSTPLLHQEVFGPYSLVIICQDKYEMEAVATHLEGQLTSTVMATPNDIVQNEGIVEQLKNICGRFIMNGVPTGVEVAWGMQHGGPYPATTDSRFTSVGPDGIRRFARPLTFQGWTNELLPDELKNENPLGIWRTVNNEFTRSAI